MSAFCRAAVTFVKSRHSWAGARTDWFAAPGANADGEATRGAILGYAGAVKLRPSRARLTRAASAWQFGVRSAAPTSMTR